MSCRPSPAGGVISVGAPPSAVRLSIHPSAFGGENTGGFPPCRACIPARNGANKVLNADRLPEYTPCTTNVFPEDRKIPKPSSFGAFCCGQFVAYWNPVAAADADG